MPHYTLTADPGVFGLVGQGTNAAEQGVFALAGQDVDFLRGYVLNALPGIFSLSGGPTVLYAAPDNDFSFHDDVTEWTKTAGMERPYVLSGAVRTGDLISGSTFSEVLAEGQRCFVSVRDGLDHEWLSARFSAPNLLVPIKIFRSSGKRTNEIRNSAAGGASAGSPGTIPTNWVITGSVDSLTRTIAVGTEGGIDYVDIRWAGTPSADGTLFLQSESNLQVVAAPGQSWVGSMFATLAGGTLTNLLFARHEVVERNAAGALLTPVIQFTNITLAAGALENSRASVTRLLTDPATALVSYRFRTNYTIGQAIDFTIRVGQPQLELGNIATAPIVTTGAAVTREEVDWPATGRRIVQLKNAPAKAISKLRRLTGEDGAIVRNVVTGDTVTLPSGCSGVLIQPSPGTIATLTIVLPPDAEMLDIIEIITTQTITALTVNGAGGDSVLGSGYTLTVGASYRYRADNMTWYRRYSQ